MCFILERFCDVVAPSAVRKEEYLRVCLRRNLILDMLILPLELLPSAAHTVVVFI